MKKTIVSILVLVLVLSCAVTLFAACGEATDYDHTIVFYSSQGADLETVTANAIASFEAKYPGWKVVHTRPGGYDDVKDKIVSDFQGKQQPDIAYCYADHVAQYIQTSKVVNLNKFINSSATVTDANGNKVAVGYTTEEVNDFVTGYYEEGYASNFSGYELYGYASEDLLTLPFVKSTELLFYNKTALDACGLSVATTWDEIWEQAPTIKAKYPSATVLGYDSEANWFITTCKQNGWGYTSANSQNHFLFNGGKQAEWLEKLNTYWNDGWLTTQEDYGSYTSGLFTMGVADGAEGIVYCVGSSGGASHQGTDKFEWGVAPIPGTVQENGEIDSSAISQGPSLVMFSGGHSVSNSEEKQLYTWLFMKELLDPTFQASFAIASGYMPSRNSVYEIDAYKTFLEKDTIVAKSASVARTMTEDFFTSPAFVGSSTARTQVGNVIVFVMQGEKTATKALRDAYVNCGGK